MHKPGLYISYNIFFSAIHQFWTWDFLWLIRYYRSPYSILMFSTLNHKLRLTNILHPRCHDPNLGLVTKAKTWKGAGQKCNPRITFALLEVWGNLHSWECEGMNPHTPKWIPTLRVGIPMESWIFKEVFRGQNSLDQKIYYTIEKFLKLICLKWVCMIHLNI
jgi:hypothetical protein